MELRDTSVRGVLKGIKIGFVLDNFEASSRKLSLILNWKLFEIRSKSVIEYLNLEGRNYKPRLRL